MLDKLEQYSKKWKLYDSEEEKEEMLKMVLDRLIDLKYIDDLQFLKDYITNRVAFKPRGKFLLSRELLLKGLDKNFIEDNIQKIELDETEMAIRALTKRSKRFKNLSHYDMKNKSFAFLTSRGFSPDAIYKAIDYHYSNNVNEDL
jgi:regulatory protein